MKAAVHSIADTTHSYTIMPTVRADGCLKSPLFVVLQETNGVFGPVVKKSLFNAENLYVMASKSGKMQKEHLEAWFRDVFFPNVQDDVALMVDSWSTYKNLDLIERAKPVGQEVLIVTCPPGTTGLCQPLDVYGIRMMKEFVRIIYNRAIAEQRMDKLHGRNALLKLLSLTHNQIACPRFWDMFAVGWHHPGYFEEEQKFTFTTPTNFCFKTDAAKKKVPCDVAGCDNRHFISCAWCRLTFCFTCFFDNYHICDYVG